MPLKLNVGLSKKVGLPDYGSLGASCHVEIELNNGLLDSDLAGFQEEAARAFTACRQAVNDELALQRGNPQSAEPRRAASSADANGHTAQGRTANANDGANGNANGDQRAGSPAHRASAKQLSYLSQLADQIPGLDARRLEALSQQMFKKPLAEMSSLDASTLIDTLKQVKAGKIDLDAAAKGVAA
ncbi:MAG TPA: hypothetical protein VMV69_05635 [Pirellulales bacterium]|nr:hypothetical protein [Pirellulales bacterium]